MSVWNSYLYWRVNYFYGGCWDLVTLSIVKRGKIINYFFFLWNDLYPNIKSCMGWLNLNATHSHGKSHGFEIHMNIGETIDWIVNSSKQKLLTVKFPTKKFLSNCTIYISFRGGVELLSSKDFFFSTFFFIKFFYLTLLGAEIDFKK